MSIEKENFLRTRLVPLLQQINPSTAPKWGKMNLQQMVEHLTTDGVCIASGRILHEKILTAPDHLPRLRQFMMSEKPFRENTPNRLIPAEPTPGKFRTLQAAIGNLQQELIYFFEVFEKNPQLVTRNPFFGDLNFEENVQLLYKHAQHHLRQFGVNI